MLRVYYGEMPDAVYNTAVYFKNVYSDEWFTDPIAKKIIKAIDKSEVIDRKLIESKVLGRIPPTDLSGGTKTLLLMLNCLDVVFNASTCGDNCAPWIPVRMMYMAASEIGRDNSRDFGGYTGQWCHRFANWLAMHAGTPKNFIPNTSNCGKGIVWFVNDAESGGFYFKNAEHKARMISNYSSIGHLPKKLTEEEAAYIPSPGDYIYFRWRNAAKDVNVSHVGIVGGVSED